MNRQLCGPRFRVLRLTLAVLFLPACQAADPEDRPDGEQSSDLAAPVVDAGQQRDNGVPLPAPDHALAKPDRKTGKPDQKTSCTPACGGKECGPDGCGGGCGGCGAGESCQSGKCHAPPKADAGPKPPDGGGKDPPGVDRQACVGVATSSGTVAGATPQVSAGYVLTDSSSGGLKLVLTPATLSTGALTIGLYFVPIAGQLSYPPSGLVGCAVLKKTASGWGVVDKTQLCELSFALIKHASSAGVCDGTLAGAFKGIFSANQPLGGTFYLPSDVAANQIKKPSCMPVNSPCSKHSDCCSQSCSLFIGVCN
jgi:hypothetical protein